MKIVRLIKKLWSDAKSESKDITVCFKELWIQVKQAGIILGCLWLIGKCAELMGMAKWFPKEPDGKDPGPMMYGILVVGGLFVFFIIAMFTFIICHKIKKTWDEV